MPSDKPRDDPGETVGADAGSNQSEKPSKAMALFDKALIAAGELVDARVRRLRQRYPEATDDQLLEKLETTFRSAVTATGAATGGAAAVPGAGTATALALTGGDASWFLTAAAAHVLSAVRVYGFDITDLEHQKAIVLTVLAGGGGSTMFGKAAGRTGPHLGKLLADSVPMGTIRSANRILGHNFVTRYGTRQGVLVLGRAVPFGIGAGGNLLMAQSVIKPTRLAVRPTD